MQKNLSEEQIKLILFLEIRFQRLKTWGLLSVYQSVSRLYHMNFDIKIFYISTNDVGISIEDMTTKINIKVQQRHRVFTHEFVTKPRCFSLAY